MTIGGISLPPAGDSGDVGAARKAAQDFEALLIGSLLRSLERSFSASPGEEKPVGSDDYQHLGTDALAGAFAARGGLGIARELLGKLLQTQALAGDHQGVQGTKVSPSSADIHGSPGTRNEAKRLEKATG